MDPMDPPPLSSKQMCLIVLYFSCGIDLMRTNTFIQLLEVDETTRLGSHGADSVKSHPWFDDVDWEAITDGSFPVPHEIISRLAQHLESHSEECGASHLSPHQDVEELDTPEWLEDW
ncbi:hypothetical protein CsSME_00051033 [Camellia sinensis var. sinensis]